MRLTPRRRAVLALLVFTPVAYFYVAIAADLVLNLLLELRGGSLFACRSGPVSLIDRFNGCGGGPFHTGYAVTELLLGTVVFAAVAYALGRWVVLPLQLPRKSPNRAAAKPCRRPKKTAPRS